MTECCHWVLFCVIRHRRLAKQKMYIKSRQLGTLRITAGGQEIDRFFERFLKWTPNKVDVVRK